MQRDEWKGKFYSTETAVTERTEFVFVFSNALAIQQNLIYIHIYISSIHIADVIISVNKQKLQKCN